jgi:uncharacterized repeat protein (TIGR03803 family)
VPSVFRVTTNGTITDLYDFNVHGFFGAIWYALPNSLTLGKDGNFYGTTAADDTLGLGTVFRVTTNGVFTTLFTFSPAEGDDPEAALTLGSDGNFYGTTAWGGSGGGGDGTVFRVTTNGVLATLASFVGANGANPKAALTLGSDGNFYGTTYYGGSQSNGTVFRVTTNGAFTSLVSFVGTNGASPAAALTPGIDGNFYGTTELGGNGYGTVFQVTSNGILTALASFNGANGAYPLAALTLGSDGNFYGTTSSGGAADKGVIYRLRRGVTIQSFAVASSGFQVATLNVGGSGWVVLESSSDLAHWTPIETNGTAAAQQFLDPAARTQPRQFYRVRQQ